MSRRRRWTKADQTRDPSEWLSEHLGIPTAPSQPPPKEGTMPELTIDSAAGLRDELAAIIRRYVQHLDAAAEPELTTVRIEATGPGLSVTYAEHATDPPKLMVSIGSWGGEQR